MKKLGIRDPVENEQCYQMGPKQQNKSRPHTPVCCFSKKFKEMKKKKAKANELKNTGIYIYQDYFKYTMEFRKTLFLLRQKNSLPA